MQRDIRKISVGIGFPNESMHFQVGKPFILNSKSYTVSKIALNSDYEKKGKMAYDIFLSNGDCTVLWKTVVDIPVMIEDNIDFD